MKHGICIYCGHECVFSQDEEKAVCPKCRIRKMVTKEQSLLEELQTQVRLADLEDSEVEAIQFEPTSQNTEPKKFLKKPVTNSHNPSLSGFNDPRFSALYKSFTPLPIQHLFGLFGPTLLVCLLFFGWVIYDRTVRTPQEIMDKETEALIVQAIHFYENGNRTKAMYFLQKASRKYPSHLTNRLEHLFAETSPIKSSKSVY